MKRLFSSVAAATLALLVSSAPSLVHGQTSPKSPAKATAPVVLPTPVREFLARRPVRFPIGLAGLNGSDLAKKLGNLRGGLPFTVLANPAGEIVWRHPGETKHSQLVALRKKLLAS